MKIDWSKIAILAVIAMAIAIVWNVASSPVEHLGTDEGYIRRMYIDRDWVAPTFDSKGRQTGGGYWDEDFYIVIEFDSGKRKSFTVSEHRWRRDFVKNDRVTIDYYKKGVLPYHVIERDTL